MIRAATVLVAIWAAGLAPGSANGQWTLQPGHGWLSTTLYHHRTSRSFDEAGRAEPFFADGRAVTTSLYVTAAMGVIRGLDVWAQLPVHRLNFENAAGPRERLGFGDPRFYLRISPQLAGRNVPIALRGGVKLPGGHFPVDAEIIPLGEGQRDWELMLEIGHSLYPKSLYLAGWAGRRWRALNRAAARKPGDEWFAFLSAGGRRDRFVWKVILEGWKGDAPRIQGFTIPSARREMLQTMPSVGWDVGAGVIELGVRIPVAGKNLPAGPAGVVGFFVTR
ncbi:MAG: hypothetical protein R2834_06650 [Rhodothermales bacterium]